MVNNRYFLALDQGGHATRAILFSQTLPQTQEVIFHTESKITTLEKPGNIIEHDPLEMLASFRQVINSVGNFVARKGLCIEAAGLATQRSSFIAISKQSGQALTPIISWQDRRSYNELDEYKPCADEIYARTGLVLNAHFGASKMRWCLKHLAKIKRADKNHDLQFAPLATYILNNILLEKPFFIDPANASRTLLMNLQCINWDPWLLNTFAIKQDSLPTIRPTISEYGKLVINEKPIPLMVCTGDQNAAVFNRGVPREDVIYVNLGTGAFALNPQPHLPANSKNNLLKSPLLLSADKTLYAIEGTVNGAGRALQWLADKTLVTNYESQLQSWIADCNEPPIFINGISGVGSPYWLANIESVFNSDASVEEKFVAVTESIIFLLQINIGLMQQHNKITQIIISGGLANNDAICQLLSDLSQLPIERNTVAEATAQGLLEMYNLVQLSDIAENTLAGIKPGKSGGIFLPADNIDLKRRFYRWQQIMEEIKHAHSS